MSRNANQNSSNSDFTIMPAGAKIPDALRPRCTAEHKLELTIGTDRVAQLNVDGACVLRIKIASGCRIITDLR